jgi:hypothetical protein
MPQQPTAPATVAEAKTSQHAASATANQATANQATTTPPTASESKIRHTAFFALVLTIIYLITGYGLALLFLLLDFTLRAFDLSRYSPLGFLSGQTAKTLKLPAKPVYMPPKRFAARIGFVFCLGVTILHYTDEEVAATILGAVLAIFAALESLVGFCAGCYVYNAWARLRRPA